MGKNINTVIFDLDGTLINSEPAALGATIEALSRFGVSASDTEVREQFGGGSRKIMQYFLNRDLDPLEAKRVIDEATDLKVSLQVSFTERVALLPNAKKMLQELKDNGFRLALATMAARDVVDKVTKYHGIDEYFDHVLTANDVVRVKPDPEVLTKTVELFGGQVNSSLYIGDSTHDLEAAVSLAMPFLLVDSGIFVRGETRTQLRISAEENGYPIVDREGLLDICEIAKNHHF